MWPSAQDASARTVQYHSQDIVPIRAKLKYTTLIQVPTTEKIMEAATGDKDFWIVDVVGNFCFVHPAKQGIASNLNLITDKGNIYSFTLQDISGSSAEPDLKGHCRTRRPSAIVRRQRPRAVRARRPARTVKTASQRPSIARRAGGGRVQERAIPRSSSSTTSTRPTKRPSIFSRSITTTSSPTSRPMRRRSSGLRDEGRQAEPRQL
jgi:hypothetical protein